MTHEPFHGGTPAMLPGQAALDRPRVDRLLAEALQSAITLVTAAPGYGKTQAVYSFLRKTETVNFWVQISIQDNLGTRFWENLTGHIASYRVETADALRRLGFPSTARQYDRFRAILEQVLTRQRRVVIVFDDCHLLHPGPVLELIERTVMTPPHSLQVIMISRTDPALNIMSLLSKDVVATITADDLRFTPEETAAYFSRIDVPLPEEEIAAIQRDTDGWPMAVAALGQELVRLPPRERSSALPRIRELSFRQMEHDSYAALPPEQRKFLVELALIEHWPPELLAEFAPGRNPADILDRAGPFVQYDSNRQSYRLHHLFAEFLREKSGEITDDEKRNVYNRAAAWCAKRQMRMDAARYYALGRNYRGLITITASFPRLVSEETARFFIETIDRLLSAPETTGGKTAPGDAEDMLYLRYMERTRFLLALERMQEAEFECLAAIRLFTGWDRSLLVVRILAANYNNLGDIALYKSLFDKNYDFSWYEKAARCYSQNTPPGVDSDCALTPYICPVGWPAGSEEYDRAIAAIRAFIPFTVFTMNGGYYGLDSLAMMEYAWFRGNLADAEIRARQALYQAREKYQYAIECRALFFLLRIALASGNLAEVREAIRQMETLLEITEFSSRYAIYHVCISWFHAHSGQADQLDQWLKTEYLEKDLGPDCFQILVKAKCYFAVKRYAAVLYLLEDDQTAGGISGGFQPAGDGGGSKTARDFLPAPGREPPAPQYALMDGGAAVTGAEPAKPREYLFGRLEKRLLQAAALARISEETGEEAAEAIRAMEEAWRLAEPHGFEMPFIELGEETQFLVSLALKDSRCIIPRPWLEEIKSKASAYAKKAAKIADVFRTSAAGHGKNSLSWRETAVLKALSLGWSRERIAKKLNMSLNTVKAEIGSIYDKLGAVNRADAVRIAIEMKIFSR
ncbi:MAG: LuxR C-terminal-related transcriptional regulator [Spirochaetaceae bacterium]|jgi:LuxR family maltose regulon positive regulatory protein|nr:LuxR C-terminal-related transcriptional regulator [Spirochaetaceae bacterium]